MSNRNMNLEVIVRLKDLLSRPLRGLRSALDGIGKAARQIGLVSGAIAAISFMGPIQEAAAFQQKLLDIASTQNLAGAAAFQSVDEMRSRYRDLALEIGQTSDTIASGAGQMIAAGLDLETVDKSLLAIGRSATASHTPFSDMAGVATSLIQTLKVKPEELTAALDALVVSGKLGSFELRDMARYFPTLTGQMAKFGVTGREAINYLGAALQIARKGTSDPAEAANNLKNFLSKILAPATIKNFKDAGVDIEAVMRDAATKGINPIEAVMQKIVKLTNISGKEIEGLLQKAKANGLEGADALAQVKEQLVQIHGAGALGELFGDMQVMDFLIPFLTNVDEYKRIKEEVAQATGAMTDADFETQMKALNQQLTIFWEIIQQIKDDIGLAFGDWLPVINEHLAAMVKYLRDLDQETGGAVRRTMSFAGAAVLAATALGALAFVLPAVGAGLGLIGSPLLAAGRGGLFLARYFGTAAQSAIGLQAALARMSGVNFSFLSRLAVGLRGMVMAVPGMSMLTGVFSAIGGAIAGMTAPAWAAVAAIAAIGLAVYKYWEPIRNFAEGFASVVGPAIGKVASVLGDLYSKVAALAGQKLLDLAAALGMDDATVGRISQIADQIVGWIKAIPGRVAGFLADIFTMNDYSDEAEAGFRDAGERAGRAMVEAVIGAFKGLFDWFRGLGQRIVAAIGKIDLSSVISWPSWPSWMGGGTPPGGPQAANQNALPATPLPAQAAGGNSTLDVNSQATIKVIGPGEVVSQSTSTSSPSPNINTGRAVGRD